MMRINKQPSVEPMLIESVMQNLRKMVKSVEAYSRTVEAGFGVTGPQLWAIWELGKNAPLSLKDLAERMHMGPSTLVGVIDRLIAKGLVRREQDAVDRRRVCLSLTATGSAMWAKAPNPAQGKLIKGLQDMDPKELKAFERGMSYLVKVMEADQLEARFFFAEA